MFLDEFTLGINYWPANKAMYWWQDFAYDEVDNDFARLHQFNINYIRIFLTWEDFQPQPDVISAKNLANLYQVADLASQHKLKLMPTFFCGHMSGANWMPSWMLESSAQPSRFPIYSQNQVMVKKIKNFYKEEDLLKAQVLQIETVCSALKGHPALYAYDLGNETSNCYIPATREEGRIWLKTMTEAVRRTSQVPITYGMHAEDLEQNRHIWPQDAGEYCDFVVMHGYPFYLNWLDNPFDVWVLPFLGTITAWLANKPVLFQELGAPSIPTIAPYISAQEKAALKCPLWSEEEVKAYYQKAIQGLAAAGMIGAWSWCYADYSPQLWDKTPLKENRHERYFGLFRHDGTPKPAAYLFKDIKPALNYPDQSKIKWLDAFERDNFYLDPLNNLPAMYKAYQNYLKDKEILN